MSNKYLNYFSASEYAAISKFEAWRTSILLPVSKLLNFFGIKANHVSYFGFLILILFIVFFNNHPYLSAFVLFLHVFIDAFDGPLARFSKQDGDAGAFVDIMCDHTGMVVVTAILAYFKLLGSLPAIIYVYLYTIMIIFTIIKNRIGEPTYFLIRTKYYLYVACGLYLFFNFNFFNLLVWLFVLLMIPSIIFGFISLKNYLLYGNKS